MAKLNTPRLPVPVYTHEGAPAYPHLKPIEQLRRSVLSCLLWESEFYEDGQKIADRIVEAATKVDTKDLAALIVQARSEYHLRHVPLLLLCALVKRQGREVGDAIAATIQRADELAEFLAIYWRDGKRPLTKQMKLGLARAFRKFSAFQLAKYNRDGAIKLRDVLFLVHPKPQDEAQALVWKNLAEGKLQTPDTWEVALSAGQGENKKATWDRLLDEGKLGYMALLRNLRNMIDAGVDLDKIRPQILERKRGAEKLLPFRYVAAARAAPRLEPEIDVALRATLGDSPALKGETIVLVDVSGSMEDNLSAKGDLKRMDAAAALASLLNCEKRRVFSFSNDMREVPARLGMAGIDAIIKSQPHSGTALAGAVAAANSIPHDRLIVITDEQAGDADVPQPVAKRAYMINVASAQHGVGYGKWTHLDGFSEAVIRWIAEFERDSQ